MTDRSRSEIISQYPVGEGLRAFHDSYNSVCANLGISSSLQSLDQIDNEGLQNLALDLVSALQVLPASRLLPSRSGSRNLHSDLSRFNLVANSHDFDVGRVVSLLTAILSDKSDEAIWDAVYAAVTEATPSPRPSFVPQTPSWRNTSSIVNSSEYRANMDAILKEELGSMYTGVHGFYEAFFGDIADLESTAKAVFEKCGKGDNPLYCEGGGWRGWPEAAVERDVLNWFAPLTAKLADLARGHRQTPKARRRPVESPNKRLDGFRPERKLDVGFVDDLTVGKSGRYHWSQILVPGELKRNPAEDNISTGRDLGRCVREILAVQDTRRFVVGFTLCGTLMRLWEFDRLGVIASPRFDISQDGLQFVSVILGFLWMNEEQLGFDPSIVTAHGKRYIEIQRDNQTERLIIDGLVKRARCVAGRATTCWKAHRERDKLQTPLVIKDSWQYPEREEEGQLLYEATKHKVINVARYYHHETVHVGDEDDDIQGNVRKGLDITTAENYKPENPMPPPSKIHTVQRGWSNSATSRKRSSGCLDAMLPPSKKTCSGSPTKEIKARALNRVHRRIILRDYGKSIYKASSSVAMLATLEGCIEGHQSLYERTSMLQRDISINNLMINEEDDNPSWRSFLIDLDLAVKEKRKGVSGAPGKTGTRAFMAIGVLLDEKHSFMHDLESFFWVLLWICIHYNEWGEERVISEFEKWNFIDMEELAKQKLGTVSDEGIFLRTAEANFTAYYQPLIPWVNRVRRRRVFPDGGIWKKPDPNLYSDMRKILREAQKDPKILTAPRA